MAVEVVDLTQDINHGHPHQLQLHIPMCPISKPSVSYGPGRGGTSVKKKIQDFGNLAKFLLDALTGVLLEEDAQWWNYGCLKLEMA